MKSTSKNLIFFDYKLTILFVISICALFFFNFAYTGENHFSRLALSFIKGHTFFPKESLPLTDVAFYQGKSYWPLGIFPAILILPFVFIFNNFGISFNQGYLQPFLALSATFVCYKIAKKLKYSEIDSLYLSYAFSFLSPFIGVALVPASWYTSQVISVLLALYLIYEYISQKRLLLIGILTGLLFLTRPTASLMAIFISLDILIAKKSIAQKLNNLGKLLTPLFLALLIYFYYNFTRFDNIFEQGYNYQTLEASYDKARSYGLFNLSHLPGNLYYFLIASPRVILKDGLSQVLKFPFIVPDPWGMSIFITSPYYIYLFFLKYKDKFSKIAITAIILTAIPILLYYGIGGTQYGYRYALDFLPLLFYLLIRNYKKQKGSLSLGFKRLILIFAFVNFYLFSLLHFYLPSY